MQREATTACSLPQHGLAHCAAFHECHRVAVALELYHAPITCQPTVPLVDPRSDSFPFLVTQKLRALNHTVLKRNGSVTYYVHQL